MRILDCGFQFPLACPWNQIAFCAMVTKAFLKVRTLVSLLYIPWCANTLCLGNLSKGILWEIQRAALVGLVTSLASWRGLAWCVCPSSPAHWWSWVHPPHGSLAYPHTKKSMSLGPTFFIEVGCPFPSLPQINQMIRAAFSKYDWRVAFLIASISSQYGTSALPTCR